MKKALITGITGQDGSYLAELLLERAQRRQLRLDLHGALLGGRQRLLSGREAGLLELQPCPRRAQRRARPRGGAVRPHGRAGDRSDHGA